MGKALQTECCQVHFTKKKAWRKLLQLFASYWDTGLIISTRKKGQGKFCTNRKQISDWHHLC